ncbi:lysophospholipid acyltransferase family protein [Coraliomargarita parva]|uniref:lysophospholipid acyltransferase family protein n=1 Tax=Coraliomargarita parva TaxID=3014050 RepID=UPI0022B2E056|nr:lysophospholipid acyltransferase family protein [Coraliomargarita parva]
MRKKVLRTRRRSDANRYKGGRKWCLYWMARLFISTMRHVPVGLSFRFGRALGTLFYRCMSQRRDIVERNLDIVNAWLLEQSGLSVDSTRMPKQDQVREVFQRAGANLLSGFGFHRLSADGMRHHLEFEGVEYLKAGLDRGKGIIMLLAHMGPWEVLALMPKIAAGEGLEVRMASMYRPLNNTYLDDWYKGARQAEGTKLYSHRDGLHKPVDFLRGGGMLGILADQKLKRGEQVPFFGHDSLTNPLPGLMQQRSGATVLSLSLATIGPARWRLRIAPTELSPGHKFEGREQSALMCNRALEQMLADSPLDGFWFHERFDGYKHKLA